jgi:HlyD family secretion protein
MVYEAVGTVRPKTETRIEARVTGQVLDVRVSPGDQVAKGTYWSPWTAVR